MEIRNNVQSPNFGMALKISRQAKGSLKKLSMDTIEQIQNSGKELEDTEFYNVRIYNNLRTAITADKDAYFGPFKAKEYYADQYGIEKPDGTFIPNYNKIMLRKKEGDIIARIDRDIPEGKTQPVFTIVAPLGHRSIINDISIISKIAKILDDAAVKVYHNVEELPEKVAVSKAVDNLIDTYGV